MKLFPLKTFNAFVDDWTIFSNNIKILSTPQHQWSPYPLPTSLLRLSEFSVNYNESGPLHSKSVEIMIFLCLKPRNSSEWILGERKSQFMNNKILFIKHSTIKRNVALDFSLLIFSRVHFPLFPVSHSVPFPSLVPLTSPLFSITSSGFLCLRWVVSFHCDYVHHTCEAWIFTSVPASQRLMCMPPNVQWSRKAIPDPRASPSGAEIHLTQFWAANFSRFSVAEEKWKVI